MNRFTSAILPCTNLTEAGLASPKKRRKRKSHHCRKRKARRGTLIQMDATPFEWFSTLRSLLHGAVDDATGEIVGAFLTPHECLMGYLCCCPTNASQLRYSCQPLHGPPLHICLTQSRLLSIQDQLDGQQIPHTQFSRAMDELGITMHKARPPQAKGRVEKLWDTLQSRLPSSLKSPVSQISVTPMPSSLPTSNVSTSVLQWLPLEPDSAFRMFPTPHWWITPFVSNTSASLTQAMSSLF